MRPRLIYLHDEMSNVVRDALTQREAEITESLRRSEQLLVQASHDRAAPQSRLDARLAAARGLRGRIKYQLRALGAVRLEASPA